MKFRKKTIVIEATQWFQNGDHPKDNCFEDRGGNSVIIKQGEIVRCFRHPNGGGKQFHDCGFPWHEHGWIDKVCPGDWIITGIHGEYYPCKPDIFEKTYEKI